MRILLAGLLVAVAFSGCLSTSSDSGGDGFFGGNSGNNGKSSLSTLTLIDDSRGQGEPSMGVTPDGVIFTNIGSIVYRSFDNGVTWENMGDPAAPIPNNDPDLAVDLDGRVWESRLYALLCNEVSVSEDLGETWSTFPVVCNGPVGDRQYVVPTRDCEAFLYWHQIPTFQQTVMRTTDCGTTWLPTGPAEFPDHHLLVNEGSSWAGGGFFNPISGSTFITYTRSAGIAAEPLLGQVDSETAPGYSMTTDGFSWTEGIGPAFDGGQLGLGLVMGAVDLEGNIYLTWGESFGTEGGVHIYVSYSTDDGANWSDKIRVDSHEGSRVFPAIAALAPGKVAIAYYKADDVAHPDNVEGNWTVELATTKDIFAAEPKFSYLPLSGDLVLKTGPICISGTTCTGGREFLDYFALKTMPNGQVAGTFNRLDSENGQLRNWFAMTSENLLA